MHTLTLEQVMAILELLVAFYVPQNTIDEVERILLPPPAPVVQSVPVVPTQASPVPILTPTPVPASPPPTIQTPVPMVVITEEQVKPKIVLDGTRDGESITFTWSASGYKESLDCKVDGRNARQEGNIIVQSVEPYTLTIVCVANKTASRAEKSLTK